MKMFSRNVILGVVFVLVIATAAYTAVLGDYDGVAGVGTNDYFFLKAYIQLVNGGNANPTAHDMVGAAQGLRSSIPAYSAATTYTLPGAANASFDGVAGVGTNDYFFLKSYIQLVNGGNANPTAQDIVGAAQGLRSTIPAYSAATTYVTPGVTGTGTGTSTSTSTSTGTSTTTGTAVTIDIQTQE